MSTFFISDLHLHVSRPAITERFLKFLSEKAKFARALYILGDFFEVWIGDDNLSNPHDDRIITALKDYSNSGIPVYFMHGNRDFLIEKQFAKASGCHLISDPHLAVIDGQRIVLTHGDALCTLDIPYQRFRRFVRSPFIKWLFLSLPLMLRQKIAGGIRAKSIEEKSKNQQKFEENILENPRYSITHDTVVELLQCYHATTLIHGHIHQPGLHEFILNHQPAKRLVLGEWRSDETFIAEFNSGKLNLIDLIGH